MTHVIQISATGGPEVLVPADLELAQLQAGQVLVDIAAAGVNFIDIYQRSGVYQRELPYVPGSEGAGRVAAVADDVIGVAVGDRVAWESAPGSYAQQVIVSADRLIAVPAGVSDEQAAAFPLQGLTAHYLATSSYRIRSADTVLIHAGAGGVGLILTQIAKTLGATVITTVSNEEKADLSRGAGADHVLRYDNFDQSVRELTGGAGVQVVYDGVGKDTFDRSLACVARRGFLVLFGGSSGQVPPFDLQRLGPAGSVSVTRPTLAHFVADPAELQSRAAQFLGWVADGSVKLRIGATYPLDQAGQAHEDLAGRRTTGKLLLIP